MLVLYAQLCLHAEVAPVFLPPGRLQAAWIEAEKEAAKRSEQRMAELAAREARLNAQADALAAQQQVSGSLQDAAVFRRQLYIASCGIDSNFHTMQRNLFLLQAVLDLLLLSLQAVAEDSARLASLQQQLEMQQRSTGASGLGSPAAAAARAAQLAAREMQLQQQQQDLVRREQMLQHVS